MATPAAQVVLAVLAKDQTSKAFRSMQRNVKKLKSSMRLLGLAAAGAFAVFAGTSVKAAIDFETSFAGIRKTMDLTEENFARLAKANRDLAKTIPVSVNELNRIGELAGQLGVRGVDNVVKFEDAIAKLAVTTDLTADDAALAFAQIINVMQEPIADIDRLGSIVVDLGNNFATTESQIVAFAQRIAASGKTAGLTTAAVFAIGTAFASVGIEAQAGGTAVQKILLIMQKVAVTGGKELERFAEILGMTTEEFKKLRSEDPAELFVQFIERLASAGDEAIIVLEQLGFTDIRTARSMLAVANAGDLLRRAIEMGTEAGLANTAMNIEAAKRFGTTASQIQLLKNSWVDFQITIGQMLIPSLTRLVSYLNTSVLPALDKFATEHGDDIQDFLRVFGEGLVKTAKAFKGFVDVILKNEKVVVAALFAIGAAMLWAFGPAGVIIVGITAVAFAFGLLSADLDTLGVSALKARRLILVLEKTLIEFMVTMSVLGLNKLPLVGDAFQEFGERGTRLKVPLDILTRVIGEIDAELASLEREAAGNRFGDLIAAQAEGAVVSLDQLNTAFLVAIELGDVLAAQQAGFLLNQGLSGMELLRAVERQSKLGAVKTPTRDDGDGDGPPPTPDLDSISEVVLTLEDALSDGIISLAEAMELGIDTAAAAVLEMVEANREQAAAAFRADVEFEKLRRTLGPFGLLGEINVFAFAINKLGEAFRLAGETTVEQINRLGKAATDALRSAFSELFSQPTRESVELNRDLAALRRQRALLFIGGATEEELAPLLGPLDAEIAAIQNLITLRGHETDILQAQFDLANNLLVTDHERLTQARFLITAMENFTAALGNATFALGSPAGVGSAAGSSTTNNISVRVEGAGMTIEQIGDELKRRGQDELRRAGFGGALVSSGTFIPA